MTSTENIGYLAFAPKECLLDCLRVIRDRLFEISEQIESDETSDNGAFDCYQAAQVVDEAQSVLNASIIIENEYNGRTGICHNCNGSGEGRHDSSVCEICDGTGGGK